MRLIEIAELLDGVVCGSPDVEIQGVSSIENAAPGDIVFLLKPKYQKRVAESNASAVVVGNDMPFNISRVVVGEPYAALACLLEKFYPKENQPATIHESSIIDSNVKIGKGVTVYPHVTIMNRVSLGDDVTVYPGVFIGEGVKIGDSTILHANVSIYKGVSIGRCVTIHSGSVIGSDGFGYYKTKEGCYKKIPQVGGVCIEDYVEIGSNVSVDRGTLGNTVIRSGTKVDNLVQIAHNVVVGKNTVIAGQAGISGSSVIGANVMMGGKAGVADHVIIEDGVMLGANSGVAGDLKRGVYSGSPAIEHNKWRRMQVALPVIPELKKKIKEQEKRIEALEEMTKNV